MVRHVGTARMALFHRGQQGVLANRLDLVGISDFVICFLGSAIRLSAGLLVESWRDKADLLETVGKFNYVD